MDGERYFYTNPLADRGEHRRREWFGCACCPPNIARLIASLPGYIYSLSSNGIWIHLYIQSTTLLKIKGTKLQLIQCTEYPWNGRIDITLRLEEERNFALHIRIPEWCRKAEIKVNGKKYGKKIQYGHYLEIQRQWKTHNKISLFLDMPVEKVKCHPLVLENTDKVALKRGPIVYCIEQTDNPEGDIWNLILPPNSQFSLEFMPNLLGGLPVIKGKAFLKKKEEIGPEEPLYSTKRNSSGTSLTEFMAIPYYAWANRDEGPMTVWIRENVAV